MIIQKMSQLYSRLITRLILDHYVLNNMSEFLKWWTFQVVNVESSAENSPEAVTESAKTSEPADQPQPGPSDESKKNKQGERFLLFEGG